MHKASACKARNTAVWTVWQTKPHDIAWTISVFNSMVILYVCVFCTLLLICSFHWLQSVCLSCNYMMMMMMTVLWCLYGKSQHTYSTSTYTHKKEKKPLKQSPINCTHHFCTINVIITVVCVAVVVACYFVCQLSQCMVTFVLLLEWWWYKTHQITLC